MAKLPREFYLGPDVLAIARAMIGKVLVTRIDGESTSGVITETEAYAGAPDRASHAFGGRRTARKEVMYARGGMAYVYLCYGIHHLFNVVTNQRDVPHAVLVRAIHPLGGVDVMRARRGAKGRLSTGGPGTAAQALGIHTRHDGSDLLGRTIYMEDDSVVVPDGSIIVGPRIGVESAGADALLPYRFRVDPMMLR
jgi:DNA-3-methyladenine glycosylase